MPEDFHKYAVDLIGSILRNDPVVIRDLHIGALVDFGPEHIADC